MTDEAYRDLALAIAQRKKDGYDNDQLARVLSAYGWREDEVIHGLTEIGWPATEIEELTDAMAKRREMLRREDAFKKVYLGDGAYVELDHGGDSVKLTTSNGRHDTNQIYLGTRELRELLSWLRDNTSIEFPARY